MPPNMMGPNPMMGGGNRGGGLLNLFNGNQPPPGPGGFPFMPGAGKQQMAPFGFPQQGARQGNFLQRLFQGFGSSNTGMPGGMPGVMPGGMSAGGMAGGQGANMLSNIQQALKLAQQVTPIVRQYGPMVKNLPAMIKMLKALNESEDIGDEQEESEDAKEEKDAFESKYEHDSYWESYEEDDLDHYLQSLEVPDEVDQPKRRRRSGDGKSTPKLFI
ncbi:MAG: hypothetical protein H0Z32_01090 [Bacillaceae bacterium]|nr:hypothetical protein [Bacillaceae bacterium]